MTLFSSKGPDHKAHPYFISIRDQPGYSSGRELMELIFANYVDEDKNFIKDFQSIGFSSRVWELSLFAYLSEANLDLAPTQGTVDYIVSDRDSVVAIEAVTSQPPGQIDRSNEKPSIKDVLPENMDSESAEYVHQLGKALRKKWGKTNAAGQRYWELDAVKDKPFVIAVETFHSKSALVNGFGVAAQYLYGQSAVASFDAEGKLTISAEPIDQHHWNGKDIPSGIFDDPEWSDVSAVIFANGATAAQFNRIGKQEGLGDPKIRMLRVGACADHDPNSVVPKQFAYWVGTKNAPVEDFAQAIHVMHNPNAKIPLKYGFFPGVSEHHRDRGSGLLVNTLRSDFVPFISVTSIIEPTSAEEVTGTRIPEKGVPLDPTNVERKSS